VPGVRPRPSAKPPFESPRRDRRAPRPIAKRLRDPSGVARTLGSVWAGASTDTPPVQLDAALISAPVGSLVPAARRANEALTELREGRIEGAAVLVPG